MVLHCVVHAEQIAKKNMINLEEVLTLTFLFLSTSFTIDLKSLLEIQNTAANEWITVEWLLEIVQKCNQEVSRES